MKTKHVRVYIGIFSLAILVFLILLLVKNGPLNTVPTSKLRFENGNTVTLDYAISTEAGYFYSVSVPDTINSAYAASQNRSSNSPGTLSHHPDHLIRKFRANPSSTTYVYHTDLPDNSSPFLYVSLDMPQENPSHPASSFLMRRVKEDALLRNQTPIPEVTPWGIVCPAEKYKSVSDLSTITIAYHSGEEILLNNLLEDTEPYFMDHQGVRYFPFEHDISVKEISSIKVDSETP